MKTLLAIALAVGLSLAGAVAPAAADQPGVWRQPADSWSNWGRQQHQQHRGGWDGRRDGNHRDRRDDGDRRGHHWHRGGGHWYGPPVVIHPPYRPYRSWVPGRWAWNGWSWVWFPGYWAY